MPRRAELPNLGPARLDIPFYRGDSLSARLHLQSKGIAVDVSQWTFTAHIRVSPDGVKIGDFAVLTLPSDGADAAQGIIRLWLPYQIAQQLPPSCAWDLEAIDLRTQGNPQVRTLLRGFIYSEADVTHPERLTNA